MRSELKYLYKFKYHASYEQSGSEKEFCWVYAGKSTDNIKVNDNEIAEWRFVDPGQLESEITLEPDNFTPWFKMEWERIASEYEHELSNL